MSYSNLGKKVIAVLCAIAMVVTSITVYNAQTAKADANATGNGKVYTVKDGTNQGFTGFTCNGMEIFSEEDGHIGFAWAEKVDPASIKVSINDAEVTTYNANSNGVFVNYSQFKDLSDGEHPIVVSATTAGENAKQVTANATLKIQDQSETEPAVTDPSAVKWDTISWLGNGTTDQANLERFKAYISPANPKRLEAVNIQTKDNVNAIYMPNYDSPADKIEVNGADVTGDCITDGAQTFVPVSILTKMYNTVVITTVNRNALSAFIYNKNGAGSEVQTTTGEVQTTTIETVETTTPAVVETTTPAVVETTTQASTTVASSTSTSEKIITLTIIKGKKTYKFTKSLDKDNSYKVPQNTKELAKEFPQLIEKGKVFKGFYNGKEKIAKVMKDTTLTLTYKNFRNIKTSAKKLLLKKGIITFKFNNKDWKNIDGVKIIYSKNSKFKGKRTITVKTKSKKLNKYVIKKSRSKFKVGEFYYFKIRYYYMIGKKRYYYRKESRKTIGYGINYTISR